MFESPISKIAFVIAISIALIFVAVIFFSSFFSDNNKLIFCNVGQGDGAYLRLKDGLDIVIDAGPDKSILHCLGKYMPFYDKTIEVAVISHPQQDHYGGFSDILDHYNIQNFLMTPLYSSNKSFQRLLQKIRAAKILLKFPKAGSVLTIEENTLVFFWPTEEFFTANTITEPHIPLEFKESYRDPNDFSLIFTIEGNVAKTLFTGDATQITLNRLLNQSEIKPHVLKVPHHSSKNGLSSSFLKLADPTYAVISVGKNNSYGHPAQTLLDMLEAAKVKIRRTDKEGDIVFTF